MNTDKLLPLFTTPEKQSSVKEILAECTRQGVTDVNQVAYILATIKHETGGTMLPIEEYGKGKGRAYGSRVWHNGTPYTDVNIIYYGRGFVQSTWRDNYVKLSIIAKAHGYSWDFEHHPELMLQVIPSAWVAVYGMRVGIFTGKKLSNYFGDVPDFENARRIINSLDCSVKIAGYATDYVTLLA
jgi:putative chitinase